MLYDFEKSLNQYCLVVEEHFCNGMLKTFFLKVLKRFENLPSLSLKQHLQN